MSLSYFGDVASLTWDAYDTALGKHDSAAAKTDLMEQAMVVAQIAASKMQWFRIAVLFFGISLGLFSLLAASVVATSTADPVSSTAQGASK